MLTAMADLCMEDFGLQREERESRVLNFFFQLRVKTRKRINSLLSFFGFSGK